MYKYMIILISTSNNIIIPFFVCDLPSLDVSSDEYIQIKHDLVVQLME